MSAIVLEKKQTCTNADILKDSRNNFILDRIISNYRSFKNEKERIHALRKIHELRIEMDDYERQFT